MMATFRLAEKLGAGVAGGFTGSPLWGTSPATPPQPSVVAEARGSPTSGT